MTQRRAGRLFVMVCAVFTLVRIGLHGLRWYPDIRGEVGLALLIVGLIVLIGEEWKDERWTDWGEKAKDRQKAAP